MAFHRCNKTLIVGSDEGRDAVYQEGRAYDDGDETIAAAIARFPGFFDSPAPATTKRSGRPSAPIGPVTVEHEGETITFEAGGR